MYGSSFRMETRRPRALSSRPMLAAVMPLPSEEVTPPVTKTYFAMDQVLRGFSDAIENGPRRQGEHVGPAVDPRGSRTAVGVAPPPRSPPPAGDIPCQMLPPETRRARSS